MRLDQQNDPEMVWQGLKGRDYNSKRYINQMKKLNNPFQMKNVAYQHLLILQGKSLVILFNQSLNKIILQVLPSILITMRVSEPLKFLIKCTINFFQQDELRKMKTDTQLQSDVMAELKWDDAVNATKIGVEVSDGVVTLSGHVDNFSQKWSAERAAQKVCGVKALAVEIDVKLQSSSHRSDTEIARTAENVLEWTTNSPKNHVKIMVESGWVTLSGELDYEYQREMALSAVRHLMGVVGVSNQTSVKATLTTVHVKDEIKAAL